MRRPVLLVAWVLDLWLALAAALLIALWVWSGSEGSLSTALALLPRVLPAGQQWLSEDVQGSLRQGGQARRLRWASADGLTLEARSVELRWQPEALLQGRLALQKVHVGTLHIDDRSPVGKQGMVDLTLPLPIDAALEVDVLEWTGPPALRATALSGHYRYDGQSHDLQIAGMAIAQGQYLGRARLQAHAPLDLDVQLQGQVRVPMGARVLPLDASASLRGPLAGKDPALQLQARLQPASGGPAVAGAAAMRASVTAEVRPHAAQPVAQGLASYQQLDLALLWPDAPRTLLSGEARVQPRGSGWQASVQAVNGLPGPWDRHQLPLTRAQATVAWLAGAWRIETLQADGAAGHIEAQGQTETAAGPSAATRWQARVTFTGIDPAQLHSQLAPARVSGIGAAHGAGNAIQFDTQVQPAGTQPAASPLAGLRLQRASVRGSWAGDGRLRLQELLLQTDDAQLQGAVEWQAAGRAVHGQLQWTLPGGKGQASGNLGPDSGQGALALDVTDAGLFTRWLRRLPGVPADRAAPDLQGRADLALQWQGGWQSLRANSAGPAIQVQASLAMAALTLHRANTPADADIHVPSARLALSGTPAALELQLQGDILQGTRRLHVQSRAQGGRDAGGDWRATVQQLQLALHDAQTPGPWTLALGRPWTLEWRAASGLRSGAADAVLGGPLPGAASLQLEPVLWDPAGAGQLRSRGQLRALRMEWLALLSQVDLARWGLSGNMVFDGSWDLAVADSLRLRASLARHSGDIRVLADSLPGSLEPGSAVDAGVREASLALAVDQDAARLTLRWDSARAGTASASVDTRITRGPDGWNWPLAAPLAGSIQARLPQVGAWSVLAPPGWRMRGTLDANLALAGSRAAPQWSGTLQADDLALRSVADGIEFGNGRLRAQMLGQRLSIQEFSLQGAGGAAGGSLGATGYALWTPPSAADAELLSRVQIELHANARALRVSARADRRLVVSGTLQALLRQSRLDIRGALQADQASFVLPEESAPRLGDDVVVRGGAAGSSSDTMAARAPAATTGTGSPVPTTLALSLDLGPDFRVQGRGIVTRLAGSLQLRANAGEAPRLSGEVRTVRGSYKAYGQLLDIDQGVMRFTGAYDNPSLDILAVRPNLSQRVGVQITGSALAPRVRLFAEPELPEAEKLAWLVLGRSGANGGAEAAVLQQAALALLGRSGQGLSGGLAGALGLDELSVAATGNAGGTSNATVILGKRISRDFYVAYERSLAGTLGTISIFYDLSRRFTLRASAGEQSAIDLIFTIRYD